MNLLWCEKMSARSPKSGFGGQIQAKKQPKIGEK
jgi:hypothetical protein